jgi:hypothetical protein
MPARKISYENVMGQALSEIPEHPRYVHSGDN